MNNDTLYTIPIVLETGINHAFVRANLHILDKHSELLPDTLTFKEKMPILKTLWQQEFNVQIIYTDEYGFSWDKIQFASEAESTMFLLTWSSN